MDRHGGVGNLDMGTRRQGYESIQQLAGNNLLSPYADYATIRSVLLFRCGGCSTTFETTGFLYKKRGDGNLCNQCKKRHKVNSEESRSVFIDQCEQKHGKYYDYSMVPVEFKKKDHINIICPKHGQFSQRADSHLTMGDGCSICKMDKISHAHRSSATEFRTKANTIHDFKYNYDAIQYKNTKTPISIGCAKHGVFTQVPDVHLSGSGCPMCSSLVSAPVRLITQMLQQHNIQYSTEQSFAGCVGVGNRKLRFDVFIPEYNLCVEYDGPHHYTPTTICGGTMEDAEKRFDVQIQNDNTKDEYCDNNNIQLIRIPHTSNHPDVSVYQFISQMTPQRWMYTWDNVTADVARLANYIKSFNYEKFAIYGISRGGLIFAVSLSNHFNESCEFGIVSYQRYDGNDKVVKHQQNHTTRDIPIFVVDDLISSGITMTKVVKSLQHKYKKSTIHPIVIYGEENESNIEFVHPHPKQWIVFPYEI